jgi:hypothetical protein
VISIKREKNGDGEQGEGALSVLVVWLQNCTSFGRVKFVLEGCRGQDPVANTNTEKSTIDRKAENRKNENSTT